MKNVDRIYTADANGIIEDERHEGLTANEG
jgi:hypothetical protein